MPRFIPPTSAPSANQVRLEHVRLDHGLRALSLLGLALVLLVPAARGHSEWLGWMPLWLVAMPAMAWWSLHRFRLPTKVIAVRESWQRSRRRRPGTQARRRTPVSTRSPSASRFHHAA